MNKLWLSCIFFLALSFSLKAQVVINEVYGGGGNSGATLKNDYIELYNNGNVSVDLTGWTVQYASSAGSSWQKTTLSGTIQPHGYYLVQEAQGAGGTVALPTPDATGSIAMSATAGKVALVSNSTTLTGTCPTGLVDFVGFGAATNCSETLPTPNLSNTTSAQRKPFGTDTGNNSTDFVVGAPNPQNSGTDITPPTIVSLFPANSATGIIPPFTATIQFSEPVVKGTGTISLYLNDGSLLLTFPLTAVTISGKSAYFDIAALDLNKEYYFEISNDAFKDAAGNFFAGFSGGNTWKFNTIPIPGILGKTYTFDICSSALPDGFFQYSVTGNQKWSCTNYGYNANDAPLGSAPYGVQINGYESSTNNVNEDWLITPAFDLTGTTYPLFSFMSRTTFAGSPLELKVSVDYSGTGNPYAATWSDMNGKFPLMLSDIWKLSENISLSSLKHPKVYLAFVYSSTSEDGARWTLDNISMINSATPPPPSLYVNTSSVRFPYVPAGGTAVETFSFTGFDLNDIVTLSTSGAFQLSKDGTQFENSISFTQEEANNLPTTVYVSFSPDVERQNFNGNISIVTGDISSSVNVTGTSISTETTLEVVNWNMEWFGSPSMGPADDNLQQQNALKVIRNLNADIYGLVEVVDASRLQAIVQQMPGYAYAISNYGSHTNINETSPSPLGEAQKLAFIYRTDIFSNISTTALLSNGIDTPEDIPNPDYDYWASGRFPFMLSADVTLNCRTENIKFILVHAKANTSPVTESYDRRKSGADDLHNLIGNLYPNEPVIVLGDYNDDLDQSITTGFTTTSWSAFTDDAAHFTPLTLPLSLAGERSTASYPDVIDHVTVSSEMAAFNLPGTTDILTDVTALVSNYAKTTSDHFPVFSRYLIPNNLAPVANYVSMLEFCKSDDNNYTIPVFTALDDCSSPVTYSFVISGETSRLGQSDNASGYFSEGTSIITWNFSDDWGNTSSFTTQVEIHHKPLVTLPVAYAMKTGVLSNTVYTGYMPAESITLQTLTDNNGSYTFEWSDGSNFIGNSSGLTVSPTVPTTFMVTVKNEYGCSTSASVFINVINVKGGKNGDKVVVCHTNKANSHTLVVNSDDIPDHLAHGDMLGTCVPGALDDVTVKKAEINPGQNDIFNVILFPNPSFREFNVLLISDIDTDKFEIRVFNTLGVTMVSEVGLVSGSTLTFGEDFRPGIYFVEIRQGMKSIVQKLVKR